MTNPNPNLIPPTDPETTLRCLRFKCISPTQFQMSDGRWVLIQADGWLLKKKKLTGKLQEDSLHRLYNVYYEDGGMETLDEPDVISLVGSAWDDAI